jgi:histidinol-phosphatase (PHP family)
LSACRLAFVSTPLPNHPRLIDCHMHTALCGHAVGDPQSYVRQAAMAGVDLICITCHIPMEDAGFGQMGIRMAEADLPLYWDWIHRARDVGEGLGVRVLGGIEAEVFPDGDRLGGMDRLLAAQPFDFVLGSLHHQLPVYRQWLQRNKIRDDLRIIDTYFRHLIDGIHTGRYDSMSHPDVIRLYGTVAHYDPDDHLEVIDDFLDALVETGTCMEVNTSGLTKGSCVVHPDPRILTLAARKGVSLTLGSDAHHPESVAQFFPEVIDLLRACGFRELQFFERRKRRTLPLPRFSDTGSPFAGTAQG